MFLKVDDSENEFFIIKARLKVETKQILRNIQPKKTNMLKLNFSKILFSKSTTVTWRFFAMFCSC